jgi:aminoglycoside phosphotransferase (APT) family kinase protein
MTNRTLTDETITEIVQLLEPTWSVREASLATAGFHIVYHLDIETATGSRQCILKATPPDADPVCGDEARLLAILNSHTDLPVPEVLGVVDEHPEFPTPMFLATELPGSNHDRTALTDYSTAQIEALGRSTGRHLAALHDLTVDAYGFVGIDRGESLTGGRPSADRSQVVVEDPIDDWIEYLDQERERVCDTLENTRFADLEAIVRPALAAEIDDLTGEFEPVVARIDQSLDNVLVDPGTHEVVGLLDWEFCVAATPAYDIEFVAESLSGGHLTLVPEHPNPRDRIRSAILEGYREAGGESVVEQFHANRRCYEFLNTAHAMTTFEPWFDDIDVGDATERQRDAAAASLRDRALELIEEGP